MFKPGSRNIIIVALSVQSLSEHGEGAQRLIVSPEVQKVFIALGEKRTPEWLDLRPMPSLFLVFQGAAQRMICNPRSHMKAALCAVALALASAPAHAQSPAPGPVASSPYGYADLADLADSASLVAIVEPRKIVRVANERAPGLSPGFGRYYVRADTKALLAGDTVLGEEVAYLVDLPLDSRGKPPKIKKRDMFVFARPVAGTVSELQLVEPTSQLPYDAASEQRLRAILVEMIDPAAPGKITGVREVIHVPGNLAGEGETQIFLQTADRSAASITVRHYADGRHEWGASFSELIADTGNPPRRNSLAWYRLSCFLPNTFAPQANLSTTPAARAQAMADYRMVLGELGVCERRRG